MKVGRNRASVNETLIFSNSISNSNSNFDQTRLEDVHLLPLGLLRQVPVEQQEEIFHLGTEDPLGLGVLDVVGHPVELVAHGFGGDSVSRLRS